MKRAHRFFTLSTALAMALASCSPSNSNAEEDVDGPAPPVGATTVAGAVERAASDNIVFSLDYGTSLSGSDANQNGIRDDIDGYLASLNVESDELDALIQQAEALHATLLNEQAIMTGDMNIISALSSEILDATTCRSIVFDGNDPYGRLLEEYTFNTPERLRLYALLNQHFARTRYTPNFENPCR